MMPFLLLGRETQLKLIVAGMLLAGAACGGGGDGSGGGTCIAGQPMSPEFSQRFEAVRRCTGVDAPEPLLRLAPTGPCPSTGAMYCIAEEDPFPCPHNPSELCGYGGLFRASCGTVVLPDLYTDAAEHEFVHAILEHATGDPDAVHSSPLFAACG